MSTKKRSSALASPGNGKRLLLAVAAAIGIALAGAAPAQAAPTLSYMYVSTPTPPAGGYFTGTAYHGLTGMVGACGQHKFYANNVFKAQSPYVCPKTTSTSAASWVFYLFDGTIVKACWNSSSACGTDQV